MTSELLGIGEVARASGLTVSALRFYDREGVLTPAVVDPVTGYRRYAAAQVRPARLVAGMRRIGVPLADIAVAVDHLVGDARPDGGGTGDVVSVRGILAEHLARLEDGLEDARREVGRLTTILDAVVGGPERGAWVVDAPGLVDALATVRFAVGADPEFAVLHGVLLELDGPTCRLVATDRYRMAVAELPVVAVVAVSAVRTTVVAPTAWVDAVLTSGASGDARITVCDGTIRLSAGPDGGAVVAEGRLVPGDYPDHRRVIDHLLATPSPDLGPGEGDASTLAARVRAATPRHTGADGAPVVVLGLGDDGLTVDEGPGVAVRREFLLQALDALDGSDPAGGSPVLRLDGPITPLVIRAGGDAWSVLMPVRLPETEG
ncbi:MAG: MerR family transcriptional regulator [Lapillicoccus sp.]